MIFSIIGYLFSRAAVTIIVIDIGFIVPVVLLMRNRRRNIVIRPYDGVVICILGIAVFVITDKEWVILRLGIRIIKCIKPAVFAFIPLVKPLRVTGFFPLTGIIPIHFVNAVFFRFFGLIHHGYNIAHPFLRGMRFPSVGVRRRIGTAAVAAGRRGAA